MMMASGLPIMMGFVWVAYSTNLTNEPAPGVSPRSLGRLLSALVPMKVAPAKIAKTATSSL